VTVPDEAHRRVSHFSPSGGEKRKSLRSSPADRVVYAVARELVVGLSHLLWRARVLHRERLPRTGPYVLAPSHRSLLDTPFLGCVTRRRIRFMGKAELWQHGWSARLLSALGGFPVDRAVPDRAALRSAVAALEAGEPVAVFPEGTRRTGPVVEGLHDGVAYLAARVGVPIVPVGIGGSEQILARGRKLPKLHRVVLVVGEPLAPPPRDGRGTVRRSDVAALTGRLQAALQALFDEAEAQARGM
jgi:1-acyl-sn-glycerol-3-phosphate acyltransferase